MNKIKVGVLQPKVLPELNSNLIKIKARIESLANKGQNLLFCRNFKTDLIFVSAKT